jgi:hypothetical protein
MAFKMKGWKAFKTKDNSNNRPDGRAGSSAFQKTIAKNAGVEPLKPTDKEKKMMKKEGKRATIPNPGMHTGPRDFTPAWEGADISEERWNSMTKKEQKAYTEKYGD